MLKQDAKILIADDSKIVRLAMTRMLQSLGYHNVVEATDGAQAVDLHASDHYDLIMLDIVMPNVRGDEALAKIRETDADTPIIMLSSVAKQSEIDACRNYGITEYLLKPLVAGEGREVLREQLGRL